MARILLIHGSCHGAWCWHAVLSHLRDAGHEARAIDLPGCGDDPTPPGAVRLEDNVAAIAAAAEGPCVLVGHSLGGISITAAAEAMPERFARLIYVAAWVPEDGQSARDLRDAAGAEALLEATRVAPDRGSSWFDDAALAGLFYHDCPDGTLELARARLTPQPMAINTTPVRVSDAGRRVPRAYIRCETDRAIPPAYQRAASAGLPTRELACGHSPFFACPERLAHHLTELAT